jgi:hemerythrin superfamily protein
MRTDLYTAIHKAQRFHLFRLAEETGRADFADTSSANRIGAELRHLIEHLRDHALNEETYIHPLFTAIGHESVALDEQHAALEADLAELESILSEGRWSDLYARYAAFLGRYLTHLAEEERLQAEVL